MDQPRACLYCESALVEIEPDKDGSPQLKCDECEVVFPVDAYEARIRALDYLATLQSSS